LVALSAADFEKKSEGGTKMSPFVSAYRGYRLGAGSLERLRFPPKKTPFFTGGRAGCSGSIATRVTNL